MDLIQTSRPDKEGEADAAFKAILAVDAPVSMDDTYAMKRLQMLGMSEAESQQLLKA